MSDAETKHATLLTVHVVPLAIAPARLTAFLAVALRTPRLPLDISLARY